MTEVRVSLLTRAPVLGTVKTRLARRIGATQALRCHLALLRNSLDAVAALGRRAELVVAGNWRHPLVSRLARQAGVPVVPQEEGGDIGARMLSVARRNCAEGAASLIIGSDCGCLNVSYLSAAAVALEQGSEVVLGPAEDGGYLLIGQARPNPSLFTDMPWSTSQVLACTLKRIQAAGQGVRCLPTVWDVDGVADWRRWRDQAGSD